MNGNDAQMPTLAAPPNALPRLRWVVVWIGLYLFNVSIHTWLFALIPFELTLSPWSQAFGMATWLTALSAYHRRHNPERFQNVKTLPAHLPSSLLMFGGWLAAVVAIVSSLATAFYGKPGWPNTALFSVTAPMGCVVAAWLIARWGSVPPSKQKELEFMEEAADAAIPLPEKTMSRCKP